jgi:hypothetical protein
MDVAPLKQSQADKRKADKETNLSQGLTEQLEYEAGNSCNLLQCLVY